MLLPLLPSASAAPLSYYFCFYFYSYSLLFRHILGGYFCEGLKTKDRIAFEMDPNAYFLPIELCTEKRGAGGMGPRKIIRDQDHFPCRLNASRKCYKNKKNTISILKLIFWGITFHKTRSVDISIQECQTFALASKRNFIDFIFVLFIHYFGRKFL